MATVSYGTGGYEVTAVEYNEEIAAIYKEYYPNDTVIVADAHEYLLKNYKNFDFIWASPPCPTHSKARFANTKAEVMYPDMKLYQEILLLDNYFKGKWIVENVEPFYEPLITPTCIIDRHFIWSNFNIQNAIIKKLRHPVEELKGSDTNFGFNISDKKINHRKDQIIRNLVDPEIGLHILNCAMGIMQQEKQTTGTLF